MLDQKTRDIIKSTVPALKTHGFRNNNYFLQEYVC